MGQRRGDVEIRNYLRDQADSRSFVFDLRHSPPSRMSGLGAVATLSRTGCSPSAGPKCALAAERKIDNYWQQYADKQNIAFLPAIVVLHLHSRRIFASSFSTGPPGDRGTLQYHWHAIATKYLGPVPVVPCGLLSEFEEQVASALRINFNTDGCGLVALQ